MKKIFLISFVLLLTNATFSQEKLPEVLKYKAPEYPISAFVVRARGEVIVSVRINKKGKVISAKVESGHPLLREECNKSAKKWIFTSDKNTKEREAKLTFVFFIEVNSEKINCGKRSKFEIKIVKPYRIEISGTDYLN